MLNWNRQAIVVATRDGDTFGREMTSLLGFSPYPMPD
jgi:hypothetical protein